MSTAYDNYDYPSYWKGRAYEHGAEVIAIKHLLQQIAKIGNVLEIGTGFGRILPLYKDKAVKVIASDPSSKLLKIAEKRYKDKKITYIHSTLGSLNKKIKASSINLTIMVRVLHHIKDPEKAFQDIAKMTVNKGFFILEFANKRHLKAVFGEFIKGNLTFPLEIFPRDLSRKESPNSKRLPFKNYHPDDIKNCLEKSGFRVIETLSVSNIRSPLLKRILTTKVLLYFEKILQKPLSKICFGPSMFLLAKKIK